MNTNKIKVICCDIDGTLVRNDKSLSDENVKWIRKAVNEKGVDFILVSGRILNSLKYFKNLIGVKGLTVSLNGTYITDAEDRKIKSHVIPKEVSDVIIDINNNTTADMLFASGNRWFAESKDTYLYRNKINIYKQEPIICKITPEIADAEGVNKYLFMSPYKSSLDKIQEELSKRFGNTDCVTIFPSADFVEIMPGKINKGTSIDDIMDYYKIDRSQIMAIGDDLNDLEMIERAGLGVAMGNAVERLKSIANYITDTNENDGVAKVIQKFVFDKST